MARPRGTWTDKHFRDALLLAVKDEHSDGRKKLRVIAEALVEAAAGGDVQAIKEVADRLDGKPAQAIVGDDTADPVRVVAEIRRSIVDPRNPDSQGL